MAVVWRESRCYTVGLRSKKKKAAVSYSTRTWWGAAPWRIRTIVSRGTPTASEGDSFFLSFLPTRDCSAWGFYASTADIYPRSRKLSAIVGLAVISQRKRKTNFLSCGRSVFPSSATAARPALVYEKRKWLGLFFFFGGNQKANNKRHTADWILYQMMNATFSLYSLLDRVGNCLSVGCANTPFVFHLSNIIFWGFYLRGKNSNWTRFFQPSGAVNWCGLANFILLFCLLYSWRPGWFRKWTGHQ